MQLASELVDRVLARHPVPVADATAALMASASAHELRDRVVECFRALMRLCGAVALAARAQFGPGPGLDEDPAEIHSLLRALRRRGLTDGQWVALCRGLLKPWAGSPGAYPVPGLVTLFHGRSKATLARLVDGLLEMRKSETVAHGATGGKDAIEAVLERRMPQLQALFELFDSLWDSARLVVPADTPGADSEPGAGSALLFMGDTPGRDRWRRVDLAPGSALTPGQPVIIDERGRPRLLLHPLAMVRRPSPDAAQELFLLDGARRRRALYVAFPSMAEHYEAGGWDALDESLVAAKGEGEHAADQPAKRPYRGLRSFERDHAELFFGRDREIEILANRVRGHGMVTVTGASGSGKSSLLHAGVLPSLSGFEVAIMRPGAAPIEALSHRIEAVLGQDGAREFCDAPESLALLCARRGVRLVVCVDQAEELFTLCRDDVQRNAFARALAAAGADPDGPTRVILSIRGDFFARLAALPALAGLYSRQVEVVTTPDKDALAHIVCEPARRFGYELEDAQLVRAMIEPLAGEPAALAMLQFCADWLWDLRDRRWKRLTWDAYDAIGGVEGALATHADAVLKRLTKRRQRAARALFLRLVTAEGTRAVVSRNALLQAAGSEARSVLDTLVDARLVVVREADTSAGEASVEIIHEALLSRWDRLRDWLDDDREYLRIRDRVAAGAAHWLGEARAADYLLAEGKPLAEAEALLGERLDILQPIEIDYIRASQRRRGRRRLWTRMLMAAALAIFAAAALAGMAAYREGRRASREAAERASAQDRAVRASLLAQSSEARATASQAVAAARANEAVLARARADLDRDPTASLAWLALIDTGVTLERERVAAEARLIAGDARSRGLARAVLPGHQSGITALVIAADSQAFATAGEDGAIKWWNVATGAHRDLPGHRGEVLDLALSPDGAQLASAGADSAVHVIALDADIEAAGDASPDAAPHAGAGARIRRLDGHGGRVTSVAFSPDGNYLATGGHDGAVLLWDMGFLDAPMQRLDGVTHAITELDFSPEGIWLAAASAGSGIRAWNLATGESVELRGHTLPVSALGFAPRGARLATASRDRSVRLWDLESGESRALGSHDQAVESVAFSADGTRVVSAGMDATVRIWPVGEGAPVVLAGHREEVSAAVFTPDSARVVSAGADKTVRIWDAAVAQGRAFIGHHGRVTAMAVTPDNRHVISGSRDGVVRIWPLAGDSRIITRHGDMVATVATVAIWPDAAGGARIASAGRDGVIRVVSRASGDDGSQIMNQDKELVGHEGQVHHLIFSPDGSMLSSAGEDGTVRLWQLAEGGHEIIGNPGGSVWYIEFSPSGDRVAAASDTGVAQIWHIASGEHRDLIGHDRAVVHVAFSADGTQLATASWDGSARIWDSGTGALVAVLGGHGDAVTRVLFTADGTRVATASWDGKVRIFSMADVAAASAGDTVEPRLVLAGHTAEIHDMVFAPGGKYLATGSADRTVRIWKLVGEGTAEAEAGVVESRVLRGHDDEVVSLTYLDERRLASASRDHSVRLWDLATPGSSRELIGHQGEVNQVIAWAEGSAVISASDDGTVRMWPDDLPFGLDALLVWAKKATSAHWGLNGELTSVR